MIVLSLILGTHPLTLLAGNFVLYWIVNTTDEVNMKKRKHKKDDEYWDQMEKELADTNADVEAILDKFEEDFEKEFGYALRQQT